MTETKKEDTVEKRELYARWPTDDIKKATTVDRCEYTPEAIILMEQELENRGFESPDAGQAIPEKPPAIRKEPTALWEKALSVIILLLGSVALLGIAFGVIVPLLMGGSMEWAVLVVFLGLGGFLIRLGAGLWGEGWQKAMGVILIVSSLSALGHTISIARMAAEDFDQGAQAYRNLSLFFPILAGALFVLGVVFIVVRSSESE